MPETKESGLSEEPKEQVFLGRPGFNPRTTMAKAEEGGDARQVKAGESFLEKHP